MCKSLHDDSQGDIPKFLCRDCNPGAFKCAVIRNPQIADNPTPSPWAAKFKKRKLRKLRAEERRLGELADSIGGRDPVALKRVYEACKVVEKQIDEVSAT